jgi:DNA mismatch repair protein MLH3
MFNDELTKLECEELIQRLSKCAFPFQCAHGRPSLVVLGGLERDPVSISSDIAVTVKQNQTSTGIALGGGHQSQQFSDAFTKWQQSSCD